MSVTARAFFNAVQRKLAALESRMRLMTINERVARHSVQTQLDAARNDSIACRRKMETARDGLQQWYQEKESEKPSTIATWRKTRQSRKLADRSQSAEDSAIHAIQIVEASIDQAERMILEAISARLDQSVGGDAVPDHQNWYVCDELQDQ